MNTFTHSLRRALPSVGRQCQPKVPLSYQIRSFSSTRRTFNSPSKQILSEQERADASAQPNESVVKEDSPLKAITNSIGGNGGAVSGDFSKMASELESVILRRPYSDQTPPHHIHVYSHRHNTILTLTRPNGSPLMSFGTGVLGFTKSRRGGYDPAYQLTSHLFAQIQERGLLMDIKAIEIIFRGFHQGRTAFTKALLGNEGRNIRGLVCRVADSTRIKFGGTRSPRVRRL
jgi:small subunit ribosomal protein S11